MNTKSMRNIREPLKKPRPLRSSLSDASKSHVPDSKDIVVQKSSEEILADLEILNVSISNSNFDDVTVMDIARICTIFKIFGEDLERNHKDALDRYLCTLRNACREEKLDMVSRLRLLEIIELRARCWVKNENIDNYFKTKISELEQKGTDIFPVSGLHSPTIPYSMSNQNIPASNPVPLGHGEVLRSSGKFEKPTKIAGKNFFKDEIVIRNSDSGKVNPGARDRLVQITGPHEESIGHAKLLVEDTIRRNASPVRDNTDVLAYDNRDHSDFGNSFPVDNQKFLNKNLQHSYSMSDASLQEYKLNLQVGQDLINVTGYNLELLKTARMVLKEYFAGHSDTNEKHGMLNSSENSNPKYELQRRSSFKSNIENSSSSSRIYQSSERDSMSPFSSSDDDLRETRRNGLERSLSFNQNTPLHEHENEQIDRQNQNFTTYDSSNFEAKLMRHVSIPNELLLTYQPISLPDAHDEVFSPLSPPIPPPTASTNLTFIPPPSAKKSYSRDFLLKCSRSPFSRLQPADYAFIAENFRDIICKSPVMFDPEKYETMRTESIASVPTRKESIASL